MPNWMELLRLQNIFGPSVYGNDLPSQGGITGNMKFPSEQSFGDMFNPITFDTTTTGAKPLPQPITPGPSAAQPMVEGADRIVQIMNQLYKPEVGANERFTELLNQYPKREDYKPSMLRRIGSMITALGGSFNQQGNFQMNPKAIDMGQELLNRPYNEKFAEWKAQIEPTYQAANLERYSNANERSFAYQTTMAQLKAEADAARAANDERKARIAEERLKIYEFKARNPNMKFDFSGPTVLVADPGTGQVTNTGIATGTLSDTDKLMLQHENKLEQIGATGEQARLTEGVRQEGREGLAETRGWSIFNIPDPTNPGQMKAVKINAITGEVQDLGQKGQAQAETGLEAIGTGQPVTKPGTTGAGQPNPQQLQAIQNKARETIQALDQLQDPNTKGLTAVGSRASGLSSFGNIIPATKGYAGANAIQRLKSLLIVDLIAEMKAQSRTGATGFGQLNMKELGVLEAAATRLDPKLDEKTFNEELTRIREKLNKILQPTTGFQETVTPTPTGTKPSAADLIKKYGGR